MNNCCIYCIVLISSLVFLLMCHLAIKGFLRLNNEDRQFFLRMDIRSCEFICIFGIIFALIYKENSWEILVTCLCSILFISVFLFASIELVETYLELCENDTHHT